MSAQAMGVIVNTMIMIVTTATIIMTVVSSKNKAEGQLVAVAFIGSFIL